MAEPQSRARAVAEHGPVLWTSYAQADGKHGSRAPVHALVHQTDRQG